MCVYYAHGRYLPPNDFPASRPPRVQRVKGLGGPWAPLDVPVGLWGKQLRELPNMNDLNG